MSVSNSLKDAVSKEDIAVIRDDLWGCIPFDPNFTRGDFKESWDYCMANGIAEEKIYEKHDGKDLNLEPTGENFDLLVGQLRVNFSKERLDKIQKIGRELYPVNEENPENQTSAHVDGKTKPTGRESSPDSEDSGLLLAGIAIGAIAGGIIGAAIFGKALAAAVGAVIGAAAGGTIGATRSKK